MASYSHWITKQMSNKILFFGNERLATGLATTAPTLRALIAAGHEVTGVVLAQNDVGPSRKARQPEIAEVATEHGIPIITPSDLRSAEAEIQAFGAEIGVLVAYGKLVPESVINLFAHGIVNIHPSLLPKHRGPTPIESVILAGESETGVSLMKLAPKMDAGPVYSQQKISLMGTETKLTLSQKLQQIGVEMLIRDLPAIISGSLQPVTQDDSQATYDDLIDKSVAQLDFTKPAIQLEREIRAYAVWPRSRTTLGSIEVIVTAAHAKDENSTPGQLRRDNKQIAVGTSDGILVIESLIPLGKKEMSTEAFLAGYNLDL
jgi:methionyl-tRNA formyltransferase